MCRLAIHPNRNCFADRPDSAGSALMKALALLIVLSVCSASATAGIASASCEKRTRWAFPACVSTPAYPDPGAPKHDPDGPHSEAYGDYDGDGKMDAALLLRPASGEGRHAISVCLSRKPDGAPELIRDAYTAGPVSTTPKDRRHYDYNTGTHGLYELDGVGSYCCECCGATYILRKGRFVEIIDSD